MKRNLFDREREAVKKNKKNYQNCVDHGKTDKIINE